MQRVRAFAHDVFTYPLPEGHRFPLPKYRLVRQGAETIEGVEVRDADAATWEQLARDAQRRLGRAGPRRAPRPT